MVTSERSICQLNDVQKSNLCEQALTSHDYCVHNGFRAVFGEPGICYQHLIKYGGVSETMTAFRCSSDPTMYLYGSVDPRTPYERRVVWVVVNENDKAPYLRRKRYQSDILRTNKYGFSRNRQFGGFGFAV